MSVMPIRRPASNKLPTEAELLAIPLAATGEYELTDKETKQLRSRIYALNKNNATFRWRTMRDAPYVILWKLRK